MTTHNNDEVLESLRGGRAVEATDSERPRVVERGLGKLAPFHRSRNSVADALLAELYASESRKTDLITEPHAFVTTNSDDFSLPNGDKREPHPDLATYSPSTAARTAWVWGPALNHARPLRRGVGGAV